MKKRLLAISAVTALLASNSFADDDSSALKGWFMGAYGTVKSTSATLQTNSTAVNASGSTTQNSSSGGIGVTLGRISSAGRISMELDQSTKANNVQNTQLSLAYDYIFRTQTIDPILGLDVGYDNYALSNLGSTNTFNLGTLGLRAGIAKTFGHNQIELLYRYSMAFGTKTGNTTYWNGYNATQQSITNYKANELRLAYSYIF